MRLAHVNVCSLPNKVHVVSNLMVNSNVNILTTTEAH